MFKKSLSLILCLIFAITLASCSSMSEYTPESGGNNPPANADADDNSPSSDENEPASSQSGLTAAKPEAAPLESSGDLGDYHIDIGGFELSKDYNGNPAIIISYTYTNNSDKAQSAMVAITERAFQNGVGLESAYFGIDSEVDTSLDMKDVQPGSSLEIKEGYLLSSETAPVEYEVSESFSFDDATLGKTFEISPDGKTEYSVAPTGDVTGELGDFTVSVVSCEIDQDRDGSDILVVHYGFTNNSRKNASFSVNISAEAFQNGIELDRAYFADVNDNSMLNIKPGAGIEVIEAYALPDTSSPVDLEITESFSFSDDKLTTTINLG